MLGGPGYDDDTEDDEEEENWMDTSWGCTEDPNLPASKSRPHPKDGYVAPPNPGGTLNVKLPTTVTTSAGVDGGGLMSRMLLNDNKAGMEGLDKDRINQVILEASKGSKYFENEKKKEEQVNKKIEEQMAKLGKIGDIQIRQGVFEADRLLEDLEGQRDLSRVIVHVDMDAFYAAVEMRDDPSLKDKPMAVGGNSMLSTSNYLARKFGVRAAMPGFIGKKLCPDLVMVKPNFEKYTAVSREIRSVMADYDPNYCPMSLDEAYLDITDHLDKRIQSSEAERTFLCCSSDNKDGSCQCDVNTAARDAVLTSRTGDQQQENTRLLSTGDNKTSQGEHIDTLTIPTEHLVTEPGEQLSCTSEVTLTSRGRHTEGLCPVCGKPFPPYDVVTFGLSVEDSVQEMRSRIEQKTKLTASAGIAPNMMLAKVCSDKNKPNGQYRITPTREAVMTFIRDLPTRKISGVGKVSERMLNALNVHTCSDLYHQRALLYHLYSPISFNYFMRICMGIGSINVERDSDRKSMSTERTFGEISKPEELVKKCQELCVSLCEDLREENLMGKTVAIKLKTVKYEVKTRAHTLPDYTSDLRVVFSAAQELLQTEIKSVAPEPIRLRLMGVRMSSLLNEDLCQKKQQNTLTRFVKQLGRAGSKDILPCLMADTDISDNKQCHDTHAIPNKIVDQDCHNSSEQIAPSVSSMQSSPVLKPASGPEFQTIEDSGYEKNSNAADLEPDDVITSTVSKNSKNLVKSENLDDKSCTESSNLTNVAEIPNVIEKVDDKKTNGDFRKGANDALLWDPASHNCESADKEENLHESLMGDNPIQRADNPIQRADNPIQRADNPIQRADYLIQRADNPIQRVDYLIQRADNPKPYDCPVCREEVVCDDLSEFNKHIDICLNKKVVMDCSRYRPEEDKKTKLSKTPNSLKKRTTVRKLSGSPSTQKPKPKMSQPSSPKIGVSCKNDKSAAGSEAQDISSYKTLTGLDAVSMVKVTSDQIQSSGTNMASISQTEVLTNTQKMVCPVCFMEQTGTSLDGFNTHVDVCLSKGTITQMLQEQRGNTKRLASGTVPSPQAVKRKRVNSGPSVAKTQCIDSFFKR
ncbi:DNA polymerase kappa-like isoform X2 [Mizuhopecten yessoensis]|uniref:DNA polymerase kappa n=1 Tax=Mizuhopecten yessoensis TaxID=6573 RepID=A0A210QVB6_MIZYE|nr:DNA polymerase kappa-like isoform X2 [Mizuhopecten yessoensis]OWF52703.1 DNA polymerase kappa [Mizuhopecten yessoensis]